MSPTGYAWLIPLLPALAAVLILLFGYRLGERVSAWLCIAMVALSTLLSAALLVQVHRAAPVWHAPALPVVSELERDVAAASRELAQLKRLGASAGRLEPLRRELQSLQGELTRAKEDALIREALPAFPFTAEIAWITLSGEAGVTLGLLLDPLAALMALMVSLTALLIHLFSLAYMRGQARYPTFFAYLSLFSAAMLGMVMSKNLFHVLLFWELMGLMSYLLIGFFFKRKAAQQAMKKAFLTTKVADLAFLAAVFWLYREFGTLDIPTLQALAPGVLEGAAGTAFAIGLLLLVGAMGKSAQFPLHVWLLDAMEGPTPVSAMIHAATMVAAGVFLLARTFAVLELGGVLPLVAFIGAFTALFAAALAPAYADIKKILAFSTVSQLGLMFLALGAWGWTAAIVHLVAHAFFKALLFLAAGSMIHGSGTQDIFRMHALARFMPHTRLTFIVGGLSLAGIVPFAGFWTKDEVMLAVKGVAATDALYGLMVVMAYAAAFLTAFYIARTYLIAFEREAADSPWEAAPWNQGARDELNLTAAEVEDERRHEAHEPHPTPHESPWPMTASLWALAAGATLFGLLASPLLGQPVQRFVYRGAAPHLEPLSAMWPGFLLGTLVALSGLASAWLLYGSARQPLRAPSWLTQALQKRLYLDRAYYRLFADPLTRLAQPVAWADRRLLDGTIDLAAFLVAVVADALRRAQTGRLEHYAWTMAVGTVILVLAVTLGGGG